MEGAARVGALLKKHGLTTAARHFDLAEKAFERGEWESANVQVRSYVEAVFEGVAAIRLRQVLKRGHARKRLFEEGILGKNESAVVQSAMSLASEQGAHAGLSEPDEATVRRFLGLAAALIGLSLLPELVRVEDVLAAQLTAPEGSRLPRDGEIVTICPTCRSAQRLGEGSIFRDGNETVYECKKRMPAPRGRGRAGGSTMGGAWVSPRPTRHPQRRRPHTANAREGRGGPVPRVAVCSHAEASARAVSRHHRLMGL